MPEEQIPPAKYAVGEYEIVIKVITESFHGRPRAAYQAMQNGKPMIYKGGKWGQEDKESEPERTLEWARNHAKWVFFQRCKTGNASREEWEQHQQFREKIQLPAAARRRMQRAIVARRQAEVAVRRSAEATCEALIVLVGEVGMSLNDAGGLLGISKQRVAQILHDRPDKTSDSDAT